LKPDGTIVLAHRLIAPVRIADYTHPLHVELPGIVHRFAKGDRIALTIAASDAAYRGTNVVGPVTISTDKTNPGVLTLPVVAASQQGAVATTSLRAGLPGTQHAPSCVDRRRFTFKIHQPKHGRVTKVVAYVNGRKVKTVKGHRITKLRLARLPQGVFHVKIVAFTTRHTRTISVRTYRGCKKGKPHTVVVRG
jgi:hypothetical protein